MRLSIVTVHLDAPECLRRTHDSLRSAISDGDTEWLLIDGGSGIFKSTDSGLRQTMQQAALAFVSEPDNGIYDAMNKGTRLASGDYVLYLNAGDVLHPDFSWSQLGKEISASRPGMVWGTCHERFADGRLVKVKNRSPNLAWYGIPVNHQNVLFRRALLEPAPYDEHFVYCADYDLIGRLLSQGCTVHRTEMPIAIFQRDGLSAQNFAETMREEETLRNRHFGVNPFLSRMITYLKHFNSAAGRIPALRRLMRKWV